MPPFVSSKVSRPTTLWFQGPLSLLSVRYVTNDVLDLIIELRTVNFALDILMLLPETGHGALPNSTSRKSLATAAATGVHTV